MRLVPVVVLLVVVAAVAAVPARAASACRVTHPHHTTPVSPDEAALARDFNHGGGALRANLYWPAGTVAAGARPDGSILASIDPDGSVSLKLGWWRAAAGRLVISGRRLDGASPPLRAHVPAGYGPRGFQATGLTFPRTGCWRVTGRLGTATLSFTLRVTKLP